MSQSRLEGTAGTGSAEGRVRVVVLHQLEPISRPRQTPASEISNSPTRRRARRLGVRASEATGSHPITQGTSAASGHERGASAWNVNCRCILYRNNDTNINTLISHRGLVRRESYFWQPLGRCQFQQQIRTSVHWGWLGRGEPSPRMGRSHEPLRVSRCHYL